MLLMPGCSGLKVDKWEKSGVFLSPVRGMRNFGMFCGCKTAAKHPKPLHFLFEGGF